MERPSVSVVVPFLGPPEAAAELLTALSRLELRDGDELVIADNNPAPVVPEHDGVRVVAAPERASAYHARNAGAAAARAEWIWFTDADCVPAPDLLDRLLAAPLEGVVAIAGEVHGLVDQDAPLARWARSRRQAIASHHQEMGRRPAGVTANLAVRRDAFERLGGFIADVRSDSDVDLSWRLHDLGRLEYRPDAAVGHRDPESLGATLRQARGYGAGRRWLRREHGREVPPIRLLVPLARAVGGAPVWLLRGRRERALFKAIDGLVAIHAWWGYAFGSNAAERR